MVLKSKKRKGKLGKTMLTYSFVISLSLPSFQSDSSSVVMTRSGLSLEELRIVEGQGQSSEIITPPEEINPMSDLGVSSVYCDWQCFQRRGKC